MVRLRRHRLPLDLGIVLPLPLPPHLALRIPVQHLPTSPPGLPTHHSPRLTQPPVIVDTHLAFLQEPVSDPLRIASTEEPCPATIRDRMVRLHPQRIVEFQELHRHALHRGPETMPVDAVAVRARGDAAEADLIQLEPGAGGAPAGVHEVRRVGEAAGGHECWITLPDEAGEEVEDAAEEVGSRGEGGGADGVQDGALRYVEFYEVVEAVVYDLKVDLKG